MMTREEKVKKKSEFFVYTPSTQAREMFFYPLVTGHFFYEKDYFLQRDSYDSFLIMYIKKGKCTVCSDTGIFQAREGQAVLLDCYQSHAYYSGEEWEVLWLHFDGVMSRKYFNLISKKGIVLSLRDSVAFESGLNWIYRQFYCGENIKEVVMSERILHLLTELVLAQEAAGEHFPYSGIIEESIAFIREHLCEEKLTLEKVSANVNISLYYFTRLFKKETGFTPHEYITLSRLNNAKYLLRSTRIPVKEICYQCGFYSESAFCNTFRKWEGMTPRQFRMMNETRQHEEG